MTRRAFFPVPQIGLPCRLLAPAAYIQGGGDHTEDGEWVHVWPGSKVSQIQSRPTGHCFYTVGNQVPLGQKERAGAKEQQMGNQAELAMEA